MSESHTMLIGGDNAPPADDTQARPPGVHSNVRELPHALVLAEIDESEPHYDPTFAEGSVERFVEGEDGARRVMRVVVDAEGALRKLFVEPG